MRTCLNVLLRKMGWERRRAQHLKLEEPLNFAGRQQITFLKWVKSETGANGTGTCPRTSDWNGLKRNARRLVLRVGKY